MDNHILNDIFIREKMISHIQIFTIIYSANDLFVFLVRYYRTIISIIILIEFVTKKAIAI